MVKSFLSANWLMRESILKLFSMLLFNNGNKFIASKRIKKKNNNKKFIQRARNKKHKIKMNGRKATMYMEEKCISCSVNVNWRVNNTGKMINECFGSCIFWSSSSTIKVVFLIKLLFITYEHQREWVSLELIMWN